MACPGGCIGGAGQPVSSDPAVRQKRTKGIYENDRMLELHKSQENPYVKELYRIVSEMWEDTRPTNSFTRDTGAARESSMKMCLQRRRRKREPRRERLLRHELLSQRVPEAPSRHTRSFHLRTNDLDDLVNVTASFCFEKCDRGPTVRIGTQVIEKCTIEAAISLNRQTIRQGPGHRR